MRYTGAGMATKSRGWDPKSLEALTRADGASDGDR